MRLLHEQECWMPLLTPKEDCEKYFLLNLNFEFRARLHFEKGELVAEAGQPDCCYCLLLRVEPAEG